MPFVDANGPMSDENIQKLIDSYIGKEKLSPGLEQQYKLLCELLKIPNESLG